MSHINLGSLSVSEETKVEISTPNERDVVNMLTKKMGLPMAEIEETEVGEEQEKEVNEINVEVNNELRKHQNVIMCDDVPVMKISASFIRGAIKEKKDVNYLLTQPVFKYLTEMHFYEK